MAQSVLGHVLVTLHPLLLGHVQRVVQRAAHLAAGTCGGRSSR